jgi:6-phosphofructokinase 1
MAGIAGGAEAIIIPKAELDPEVLAEKFRETYRRGKAHAIVVVAEWAMFNAHLAAFFKTHEEHLGFDLRVMTPGHVQRGGMPGAFDSRTSILH